MQQTTTPLNGTEESKRSAAAPGESGGETIVDVRVHQQTCKEAGSDIVYCYGPDKLEYCRKPTTSKTRRVGTWWGPIKLANCDVV